MKPTPKELLELYQTATESLEEMFRKYELTIAEQAEKIEVLKEGISAYAADAVLLKSRIEALEEMIEDLNPKLIPY
jgi:polyhydroxyalkanoate synthesis regulator phasin